MQVRPRFGRIRDTIHHPTAQIKVSLGSRYYSFVHFLLTIDTGKKTNIKHESSFDKLHEDTVSGKKSGTVGR